MGKIKFTPKRVSCWKELRDKYDKIAEQRFIFRGQVIKKKKNHSTDPLDLITSFEHALLDAATQKTPLSQLLKDGLGGVPVWKLEEGLLREFQRKCCLYLDKVPSNTGRIEWLALMRHYGAPTRLLDWTYSFYSAVFMALDRPSDPDKNEETVIWAIDTDWLERRMKEKCKGVWEELDKDVHIEKQENWNLYFKGAYKFFYPVSPFRLNERLTIQQGTFLCQGDISTTFEDNLAALQSQNSPMTEESLIKFELILSRDERIKFLKELYRMNMTKASMYPGLQGFAESLKMRLIFPKILGDPIQGAIH